MKPYSARDGQARLAVRVTPRAKRTQTAGIIADAEGRALLAIKLAAPPVEGAANDALIAFVAKSLKLKQNDVTVLSGAQARMKVLSLSGDAETILARLAAWIG